jgi:hypothetical protein
MLRAKINDTELAEINGQKKGKKEALMGLLRGKEVKGESLRGQGGRV